MKELAVLPSIQRRPPACRRCRWACPCGRRSRGDGTPARVARWYFVFIMFVCMFVVLVYVTRWEYGNPARPKYSRKYSRRSVGDGTLTHAAVSNEAGGSLAPCLVLFGGAPARKKEPRSSCRGPTPQTYKTRCPIYIYIYIYIYTHIHIQIYIYIYIYICIPLYEAYMPKRGFAEVPTLVWGP